MYQNVDIAVGLSSGMTLQQNPDALGAQRRRRTSRYIRLLTRRQCRAYGREGSSHLHVIGIDVEVDVRVLVAGLAAQAVREQRGNLLEMACHIQPSTVEERR